MKLYYSPGACSLSSHIALREAGVPFDLEQVDLAAKQTKSGADFKAINPKGYVPTLQLDDGEVLTEAAVIAQYVADHKPEAKLAPPHGTVERRRLQESLNFIATEVHKGFSPLWKPTTPDAYKQIAKETLAARFGYVDGQLAGRQYLLGDTFTAPDAYLYVMTRWGQRMEFDFGQWPNLKAFAARVDARPKVQEALKAEGLIK